MRDIPVLINNFNRLNYLSQQINWLESQGIQNIFIIDNDSTYEPLVDYYSKTPHNVIKLKYNVGYLSPWETVIHDNFRDRPYIYTDSDIVPVVECPNDWLDKFFYYLDKYSEIQKVGFGLKIDDLPDSYKNKYRVIKDEQQFWVSEVEKDLFDAPIDTTFALYRPHARGGYWEKAYRTGGDYVARHLPWYADSENPTAEDLFYSQSAKTSTYWTKLT